MSGKEMSRNRSLLYAVLVVGALALIVAAVWFGIQETGPNVSTGRYVRAADGTDLFLRERSSREPPEITVIRDREGDTHVFDSCSTGDLIRIEYVLITYEAGQACTEVYEWEWKKAGTAEDIPADIYAEISARFPG